MDEYPAKGSYLGPVAHSYDSQRFSTAKGRWIDRREKRSITRGLAAAPTEYSVLDLPCGTGRITEHVLGLGYRVSGADIAPDMIELARQRIGAHPRLEGFHQVDAEHLSFPDRSFDCVTSVRLMGHLPPDAKKRVLREMARVARHFVIVTFYLKSPLRSIKWFLTHGRPLSKHPSWYPITEREVNRLCDDCGLRRAGRFRVAPIVSDGLTLRLTPESDVASD